MTRYYYGFHLADPPPVGNAQLGIKVHTAMEALYGYDLDPLAVLTLLYGQDIEARPEYEEQLRKEQELAAAMVSGYLEWAISESVDADLRLEKAEAEIRIPMPGFPGVELRARLDQILHEISTGHRLFLDFKTADSFDAHTILELNPQFRFYSVLMHLQAGIDWTGPYPDFITPPMGGIIRTLRRCKRTERARPPFYASDPFRYNPDQLTTTWLRTSRIVGEIMEARAALDEVAARGGDMALLNSVQRHRLRPVPIATDCKWRCELSKGVCVGMDDGSDWAGMLRSPRFEQGDPYAYYERGTLDGIRRQLAAA